MIGIERGSAALSRRARKLLALADRVPVFKLLLPLYALVALLFAWLIARGDVQLLNPAGSIAGAQSKILWAAIAFAAIVGGTLIASFFIIVFRYREGQQRRYEPTWTTGKAVQLLAWALPTCVVLVVSFFVWSTAHTLDPYKPLNSKTAPLTIQVVALQWKWLFIYPNDRIATVNKLVIPAGTPISLQLTADAPMSSFWVPRLSGQIYAMTGMVTQLHIMADKPGAYAGNDVEINGDGYSGMEFSVQAVTNHDFAAWKNATLQSGSTHTLDTSSYVQLAKPSSYNPAAAYRLHDSNLFDAVVMQYMEPGANLSELTVRGAKL
jgi:cytochrome o ubiquinol oxidase subunit 2